MRKIVMSELVAAAALLGCAGPAFAGTGTTGNNRGGHRARRGKAAFLQAVAARYPAGSAAGWMVASYMGRLTARAQASATTTDVWIGSVARSAQ